MAYRFNYQIQHTITEHTYRNLHEHTRACLSATCLHAFRKFRQRLGSRPNIFYFPGGYNSFRGKGGSNCYFIKKRVDFQGRVVRTSSPLWTCAQPIYMCLCIKPLKCSRQYFFSKDIGFHSLLKILCRQNHYFIAFVLGSTSRNHKDGAKVTLS